MGALIPNDTAISRVWMVAEDCTPNKRANYQSNCLDHQLMCRIQVRIHSDRDSTLAFLPIKPQVPALEDHFIARWYGPQSVGLIENVFRLIRN